MPKATDFKLPKSLATCADLLYETQQERYALQRAVDTLSAREAALREHLIQHLPKSDATGVAGKTARVTIVTKQVVSVTDFPAYFDFVVRSYKKNPGALALIQRRVGDAAVKELWAAQKDVPGVTPLNVPTVSVTKV